MSVMLSDLSSFRHLLGDTGKLTGAFNTSLLVMSKSHNKEVISASPITTPELTVGVSFGASTKNSTSNHLHKYFHEHCILIKDFKMSL